MNGKALTNNEIKEYVQILDKELKEKYLSSPILYSKDTFIFHISGKGYHSFNVSLDGSFPRVYLSYEALEGSSLEDKFVATLKKEISNAYIKTVSQYKNDRVIRIDLLAVNSVFKEEEKHLYIELIPHHPNLVLTDENDLMICAFKTSSIDNKRPIMRGLSYLPLENSFDKIDETRFSFEDFQQDCKKEEINLANKRKKERFGYAFTYFKNREKLLKRKVSYLEKDIEEAKKHLDDNLKGDAIYICYSSINNRQGSFEYEGLKVDLDPSRSLSNNAERYYKRAKKAKESIEQCNLFLAKTKKELEDTEAAIDQMMVANEAALETMAKDFKIPSNSSKGTKDKNECVFSSATIPYYVEYNGTKFLFGKNAKQNAFLSFMYATSKEHYWFHIAKMSGSHVIIKKDDPSDEEIRIAAEICLINSSQKDGDVIFTKHKNIKRGHFLGEAVLKEYETIHLKDVSSSTEELLKTAKRISLR